MSITIVDFAVFGSVVFDLLALGSVAWFVLSMVRCPPRVTEKVRKEFQK